MPHFFFRRKRTLQLRRPSHSFFFIIITLGLLGCLYQLTIRPRFLRVDWVTDHPSQIFHTNLYFFLFFCALLQNFRNQGHRFLRAHCTTGRHRYCTVSGTSFATLRLLIGFDWKVVSYTALPPLEGEAHAYLHVVLVDKLKLIQFIHHS